MKFPQKFLLLERQNSSIRVFEKIQQLQQLKKLQDDFKKERMTVEKNGVFVTMNGNFEVLDVKLNSQLSLEDQQSALKQAINEVRESIQKKLAQHLIDSGLGI